ncbi:sporulation protein [Candidatus Laterigemmans baculatus]|uniref:sporulation protein n=1 Tax=Candidatus Laterigemmans baculatus TaxID=2770505 RepID=UPI0013DB1A99|nr:sporulation protein [Candidatus Laterigemmans baculatus]
MAKCDLSIEMADGDRIVRGGERVRGTVVVRPDGDFNCKGLQISTRWETHGRGNIDSGEVDSVTAFEGEWRAGETYRYEFDLASGTWPPTYHGSFLTVEHVVRATAKLPWKFDPTVAHPFRVYVTSAPESGAPEVKAKSNGPIATFLITLFLIVFGLVFLLNPFFWCFGAVVAVFSGGWWFFRKVLPKRRLGPVEFRLDTPRLSPGETVRAELVVKPKKNITLNGITMHLHAKEVCVSGSGTNRTTHAETVHEERISVMAAGELQADKEHRFPIEATLPMRPIYSIDLSDNDIEWTAKLRIDIPRWPDWVEEQKIKVVPPTQPAAAAALLPGARDAELGNDAFAGLGEQGSNPSTPLPQDSPEPAGVSFEETVNLVWANREQFEMIDQVVEAVQGLVMNVSVDIERRSLYADSDEPSFADREGTNFLATYPDPPQPIMLHIRGLSLSQVADIERQKRWSGPAQIVGYDRDERRLLVKSEE